LHKDEVGGFEVGMYNVVVVDRVDAFEHFFPVIACEGEVEAGVGGVEFEADDAGEVGFAEFEELGVLVCVCKYWSE
jgi:hypothetical protein